jgi:hypothetical protein
VDAFGVSVTAAGKAIPAKPNATAYCFYQQNGKTLAFRQPNDQVVVSTCFRSFLGECTAVSVAFRSACDCGGRDPVAAIEDGRVFFACYYWREWYECNKVGGFAHARDGTRIVVAPEWWCEAPETNGVKNG